MFDLRLQVFGIDVVETDQSVEVVLTTGVGVPGPQGLAALPMGSVRYHIGKNAAEEIGKTLLEAGENLPEPPKESDLIIPTGAEAAKVAKAAKEGPSDSK